MLYTYPSGKIIGISITATPSSVELSNTLPRTRRPAGHSYKSWMAKEVPTGVCSTTLCCVVTFKMPLSTSQFNTRTYTILLYYVSASEFAACGVWCLCTWSCSVLEVNGTIYALGASANVLVALVFLLLVFLLSLTLTHKCWPSSSASLPISFSTCSFLMLFLLLAIRWCLLTVLFI